MGSSPQYLVPAAHSFLEARAAILLPCHARLAMLDYLLEGDRGPDYLKRALFLARAERVCSKRSRSRPSCARVDSAAAGWRRLPSRPHALEGSADAASTL